MSDLIKCAIINDGVVVNVIEYETVPVGTPAGFDDGHIAVATDSVSIGWVYDGKTFTNPAPPVINDLPKPMTLIEQLLASPTEIAALKTALGIV